MYAFGTSSIANNESLIPISNNLPITQVIQAFNGKDNDFSKSLMNGITRHEKEVRASLSKDPAWAEVAPYITVGLSDDGESLSYGIEGSSDIKQKYMELEYGGTSRGASGRIRSIAHNSNALSTIIENSLNEFI
jgi:hypothetical protein